MVNQFWITVVTEFAERHKSCVDKRYIAPPGNKTGFNKPNISVELGDIDAGLRKIVGNCYWRVVVGSIQGANQAFLRLQPSMRKNDESDGCTHAQVAIVNRQLVGHCL